MCPFSQSSSQAFLSSNYRFEGFVWLFTNWVMFCSNGLMPWLKKVSTCSSWATCRRFCWQWSFQYLMICIKKSLSGWTIWVSLEISLVLRQGFPKSYNIYTHKRHVTAEIAKINDYFQKIIGQTKHMKSILFWNLYWLVNIDSGIGNLSTFNVDMFVFLLRFQSSRK